MKNLFLAFFLLPSLAISAPFSLLVNQRNIADTATLQRTVPVPALDVSSMFGIDQYTNLPALFEFGTSMGIIGGKLECGPEWVAILNKPTFAAVATSGDYHDLINQPTITPQANADWLASSGVSAILNRPSLAAVATSGSYSDLSGAPAIPAAQVSSDWAAGTGISQVLNKPTTLSGYGIADAYPRFGNPSNFLTGVTGSQVIAALGFTPYNAANTSNFVDQSGARTSISLTTTGTAGAATYNSATGALNIPNYAPGTGTVTSVTAGAGLSGGTITTSGTISLPNTGMAGSYAGVTTDAQGRVTAGTVRSQSVATRSLNAAFQVSQTRDAEVSYSVQCTITASISGGQACDVILEIASDAAFTSNVQTLGIIGTGQTYTLAIAIQGVAPQTAQVSGYVPAGYYARLRTVNVTGSPSYLYRAGQETLF